jgi:exopolysaccharide production protein ExoZ
MKFAPTTSRAMLRDNGSKLIAIQYLRAVAAASVVLFHASTALFERKGALIHFQVGTYGVDMFFVISGFIMAYTARTASVSPRDFVVRRAIRIVPVYFLLTTLTYVLALALPERFSTASGDIPTYVTSIFFIPHFNPLLHYIQPLLGQGWTLNAEIFFYLLFAIGLLLGNRPRVSRDWTGQLQFFGPKIAKRRKTQKTDIAKSKNPRIRSRRSRRTRYQWLSSG